jgi:Mor family transcriptional regulator
MDDGECFVDVVAREAGHAARSHGIAPEVAARIADETATRIMRQYGGQQPYVRRTTRVDRETLLEAFDGRNHRDLARRFGKSVRRVRQILGEEG